MPPSTLATSDGRATDGRILKNSEEGKRKKKKSKALFPRPIYESQGCCCLALLEGHGPESYTFKAPTLGWRNSEFGVLVFCIQNQCFFCRPGGRCTKIWVLITFTAIYSWNLKLLGCWMLLFPYFKNYWFHRPFHELQMTFHYEIDIYELMCVCP